MVQAGEQAYMMERLIMHMEQVGVVADSVELEAMETGIIYQYIEEIHGLYLVLEEAVVDMGVKEEMEEQEILLLVVHNFILLVEVVEVVMVVMAVMDFMQAAVEVVDTDQEQMGATIWEAEVDISEEEEMDLLGLQIAVKAEVVVHTEMEEEEQEHEMAILVVEDMQIMAMVVMVFVLSNIMHKGANYEDES